MKHNPKFKIGDKVKTIDKSYIGKIIEVIPNRDRWMYSIKTIKGVRILKFEKNIYEV